LRKDAGQTSRQLAQRLRNISIILSGALVAIGAGLLALYLVSPGTNGNIVSTKISFWGGIASVSLGMVWLYNDLFGRE
jgi:hypothetical protein